DHLQKRDPLRLERLNQTAGKILIDGNTAAAIGAMFGGVTVVTWYPITPCSSLVEALVDHLERFRKDPETGKATYAVVQAEEEDGFSFAMKAFDLAERLQAQVFVLSDLDLGMNNWMSDPFAYPEQPWDRGKVLDEQALAKLPRFERYRDADGDGIPWRTLPGVHDPKGAYFTRGSGHDEGARYTEDPETYQRVMDRLARKFETARTLVPPPVIADVEGAEVGIIAFGSTHLAMVEARDQLAA